MRYSIPTINSLAFVAYGGARIVVQGHRPSPALVART